ncbi:MAG: hypothetical protein H6746_01880 [Deltaproteobacteria bacterium]|nr:hypothetical protein [Deltaproteobacteria bacterium]
MSSRGVRRALLGLTALLLSVAAQASPPGIPDIGGRCADCHTTSDWTVVPEKVSFDHRLTGFALRDRHAELACTDCHGPRLKTRGTRGTCASCHFDPHRGSLGQACATCHDARSWRPSDILVRHRATRFPLIGAHAAADCTSCHLRGRQEVYRGTPTACIDCHASDFRRPDIAPNHITAGFSTACDSCHSQVTFSPARIQHDVFWPLRGGHAAQECEACHTPPVYGGVTTRCYDCHQKDYQAAASPPHAAYAMSRSCENCHTDTAWEALKPHWHDTRFRISSGSHSRFDCGECHFQDAVPPANFTCIACHGQSSTRRHHGEVSAYVWENFACYGCHPHGGR